MTLWDRYVEHDRSRRLRRPYAVISAVVSIAIVVVLAVTAYGHLTLEDESTVVVFTLTPLLVNAFVKHLVWRLQRRTDRRTAAL
jgi:hypothetical protein